MFCSAHLWFNSASPTEQCRSHIALSTECCGNLNLNFHCYRIWTTLTLSGEVAPGPSSSTGAHTPAHVPAVDIRHLQYPQERLIFFLSFFFFPYHTLFLGHDTHSTSPLTSPGLPALHSLWRMVWQRRHPECLHFHP